MLHRLLIAFGVAATTLASAAAQPVAEAGAGRAIRSAIVLSDQIRRYHQGPGIWTGLTPAPPGYCATMAEGEAVLKLLTRLSNGALINRLPGLALRLQQAADRLSDALDEEEEINLEAGMAFVEFPCPVASPYPARAAVLARIRTRAPFCQRQAYAREVSFNARRVFMQLCLRQ